LPRKEDARLTTGAGRFSDDFSAPDQCYLAVVRSPYPHARIRSVNFAAARAMPGVLGTYSGADCLADRLSPIPHDPLPKTKYDMKLHAPGGGPVFIGPHMLLPADKVRHVGEAVAAVVAETQAQALDAAEAVEVGYEELPFVLHAEDAMKPGAPLVWDEAPQNIPVDTWFGDKDATDKAFAAADHVVAMGFHIDRVTGRPARAARVAGRIRRRVRPLYAACRERRRGAAKNELANVLAVAPDKCVSFPTTSAAISAPATASSWNSSRVVGRRQATAPGEIHRDPLGMFPERLPGPRPCHQGGARAAPGRQVSRDAGHQYQQCGRALRVVVAALQGRRPDHRLLRYPAATLHAVAVYTNTMPTSAYRSSGRPEVTFAIDGWSKPRRRSLASIASRSAAEPGGPNRMPYRNAVGMVYDSGRYEENMDTAMEIAIGRAFRRGGAMRGGAASWPAAVSPTMWSPRSAPPRSRRRSRCAPTAASTL